MTAMKWLILLSYLMVMAFRLWLRRLNLEYLARHGHVVPRAFRDCIDQELLQRTSEYTLANSRVALVESLFSSLLLLLFLFGGLLGSYDAWIDRLSGSFIVQGILFVLGLSLVLTLLDIPFSLYRTFVLEERFQFNTSTPRIWVTDLVKSLLIGTVLLSLVTAGALAIVQASPDYWWLWVWGFLGLLTLPAFGFAAMEPYRLRRITGFLDPWADEFGSGFQLIQALIAIGRGELTGVGIGASIQKLFYLPEAHTDFIFAVLAEELGLLGVIFVLGLFLLLVTRIMVIGMMAHRKGRIFQGFVAYGIGLWIGLQALVNIGVNLGVLPTKGLTLPLISSGGSSMLMVLVAIGVVLRIKYELDRDFGVYEKSRKPVRRGAHKEAAA